ncbi:MAG: hypothetical protein OSB47_06865, partial [Pirellulaceae bacterium]|nr:hypothetical protein [Pirellulaceae bacterium]
MMARSCNGSFRQNPPRPGNIRAPQGGENLSQKQAKRATYGNIYRFPPGSCTLETKKSPGSLFDGNHRL